MKQHALIGHFGPHDLPGVRTSDTEIATRLNLVTPSMRLDHGMGDALSGLGQLGVYPSELGLDLLVLAAHVHAADTRISRATESQDTWTREIHLVVPVSEPAKWTAVAPILTRMLNFLTGDRWTFSFRPRPHRFEKIAFRRPKALKLPPFDALALFSGGLDSLIGAIDSLEDAHTPLLISHASEGAVSDAQSTCYASLKAHYSGRLFNRLRLWMSFPNKLVHGVESEMTTRGRSFLFIALGVFAGTGLDREFVLDVPENGLIALNVPLDPLRLGSLSTHTTHPFYLARWNELLDALEIPGHVHNPFWGKTKGELVERCSNPELLRKLIPMSLSCSSPTKGRWQHRGVEHCGYCFPCLIRRAAIDRGLGAGADPTPYSLADLSAKILDTRLAEGQQIRSVQFASARLLTDPSIAKLLIHKPGPLLDESPEQLEALAGVYTRGIREVATLLTGVLTQPS